MDTQELDREEESAEQILNTGAGRLQVALAA
jgi:hypothetical protein